MLRGKIWRRSLMAAVILAVGGAFTALAGTTIPKVRVAFINNYDTEGREIKAPDVRGEGGYQISAAEWSVSVDAWEPGEKVTASVVLTPEAGKSFLGTYSSEDLAVQGAELLSAVRREDGSLLVKASYSPVVQLGKTEMAGWSGDSGAKAVWSKVPYATAYQVRVYRGEDEYVTTLTLTGTSVDLTEYIGEADDYFYEVRATSKNSSDAACRRVGAYVKSEKRSAVKTENKGSWRKTADGYRYTDENGRDASGGWRYIGGVWYYFDTHGYAMTGWQKINGKWYYLNDDCQMQTGWLHLDNNWYYTDSTGAMVVGWYQMSPAEWYYFYEDGRMAADTEIDGYRIQSDGLSAR